MTRLPEVTVAVGVTVVAVEAVEAFFSWTKAMLLPKGDRDKVRVRSMNSLLMLFIPNCSKDSYRCVSVISRGGACCYAISDPCGVGYRDYEV